MRARKTGHKALSPGRCDGHRRNSQGTGPSSHKALSPGRCDGLHRHDALRNGDHVTKPCHRAGVTDLSAGARKAFQSFGHKALSPGRCEGPQPRSVRAVDFLRHKALSPGRCDGQRGNEHSSGPVGRHKALSPGRCDGHRNDAAFLTARKSQSPVTGQV